MSNFLNRIWKIIELGKFVCFLLIGSTIVTIVIHNIGDAATTWNPACLFNGCPPFFTSRASFFRLVSLWYWFLQNVLLFWGDDATFSLLFGTHIWLIVNFCYFKRLKPSFLRSSCFTTFRCSSRGIRNVRFQFLDGSKLLHGIACFIRLSITHSYGVIGQNWIPFNLA